MSFQLLREEDVGDLKAVVVSAFVGALSIGLVLDVWPQVAQLVVAHLRHYIARTLGSRLLRRFFVGCLLAFLIGIGTSVAVRSYLDHPLLAPRLARRWDHESKNLMVSTRSFSDLVDSCNDLDYAAQIVAIGGGVPFVLLVKVIPESIWKDVTIPVSRWLLLNGFNSIVRVANLSIVCWGHFYERAIVIWNISVRCASWLVDRIVAPVARFAISVIQILVGVISTAVSFILQFIGGVIQLLLDLIIFKPFELIKFLCSSAQ